MNVPVRKSARLRDSVKAVVIVAHPDDETIWAGGTILMHSDWHWTVIALCRKSDPDRAPRFMRALRQLGASGGLADLDDGPEQLPLPPLTVEGTILHCLSETRFDFVLAHSPFGEYSRHLRHEEIGGAVSTLWNKGRISASELWMFAYEDGRGRYLPRPIETAHRIERVPDKIWRMKYRIMTETYIFRPESFEARVTQRNEAFWCFRTPTQFNEWLANKGRMYAGADSL